MKKSAENKKMVYGCHKQKYPSPKELFTQAPKEVRSEFRDAYLARTGMSYPSFYRKLVEDKFRPLEMKAFYDLMKKHPLVTIQI